MAILFYLNYFFDIVMGFMENRLFSHFASLTKQDFEKSTYGAQYLHFLTEKLGAEMSSYRWDLGKNLLIFACKQQNHHLVEFLLKNGHFDLTEKDYLGFTVVHWACYMGNVEILKLFEKHKMLHFVGDRDGNLGIHWAVTKGVNKVVEYYLGYDSSLLFHQNHSSETAIHSGCKYLQYNVIRKIFGQIVKQYDVREVKRLIGEKPLTYGEGAGAKSIVNYAANRADLEFLSDLINAYRFQMEDFYNLSGESMQNSTYPLELIRKTCFRVKQITSNFKAFSSEHKKMPMSDLRKIILHKGFFSQILEQENLSKNEYCDIDKGFFFNVIDAIYKIKLFSNVNRQIGSAIFTKLCNQLFNSEDIKREEKLRSTSSVNQESWNQESCLADILGSNKSNDLAIMSFVEHVKARDLIESSEIRPQFKRSNSLRKIYSSVKNCEILELRRFSCQDQELSL